ncbi:tRNA (adenosine(37)-N6)-dimethylallyltransferase MiaA [Bacteroidetes bacterium endosymbiont of Geopemphigus sp.]|uniref:tRNA (adenosine(37)-N6)-dimethylallyltransferase MiaA n=1 Tax=Bacteroidetes bacterium endosymbiont of Geopemphigus sp. TaxID=2047937 RepID=UPI000CD16637|nr:tRNA (adenosine(37)-N6)-dimethylallyltransferase MiaA [Bacteroidetes bacterium endosymbiont of Geopemphigus sp.]
MRPILITIIGPTAVGKTSLSLDLAKKLSCEIVSYDARQFYRELKIGTSPPDEKALKSVRHHFIGHLSIYQTYTSGDFEKEALRKLDELFAKYSTVLMVGGSGLYEKALIQGLDIFPEVPLEIHKALHEIFKKKGLAPLQKELKHFDPFYYHQADLYNPQRLIRALGVIRASGQPFSSFRTGLRTRRPFRVIKIGLHLSRQALYLRINKRVDQMIQEGLLQEAKTYHPYKYLNPLQTVGYRELFSYFEGLSTLENAIEEIKKNTRRYAKRQLTWYRKDQEVNWFFPDQKDEILNCITRFIESENF